LTYESRRDEFKQFIGQFLGAFPDLGLTVDDVIAAGDKVVTRLTVRGTHSGDLMGIPASGTEATWTDVNVYRVAGGKIVEEWFCGDYLGMMQQIGAIPAPTRTA
jgi:predicted ester cyclase